MPTVVHTVPIIAALTSAVISTTVGTDATELILCQLVG